MKAWPEKNAANLLGVKLANVYVVRHRISTAIQEETKRLKNHLKKEDLRESVTSDTQNKTVYRTKFNGKSGH